MKEVMHLYLDDETIEIVNKLKKEISFKNLSNSMLFAIGLSKGFKEGIRSSLSNRVIFVHYESMDKGNFKFLLMATVAADANNLEVFSDKKEYYRVCEEYAKTGLTFLEAEYVQNSKNIVDVLELEALEFFDNYVSKGIGEYL